MVNPHEQQRRRVEANVGGLHESRETHHEDWTRLDEDRGEGNVHHYHHHHHGHGGERTDRDYERLAEQAHSRTGGSQHGRTEGTGGNYEESGHHAGRETERRYGKRRRERGQYGSEHGSPHAGSQRGSHREQGISGRMTGQRGSPDRHADPSDSTFREETGGGREHRHGGERGTSERDRRYGSRRGHGTERRHSTQ